MGRGNNRNQRRANSQANAANSSDKNAADTPVDEMNADQTGDDNFTDTSETSENNQMSDNTTKESADPVTPPEDQNNSDSESNQQSPETPAQTPSEETNSAPQEPAPPPAELVEEKPAEEKQEAAPPVDEVVMTDPEPVEVAEEDDSLSTDIKADDSEAVKNLKTQLVTFRETISKSGKVPTDYKAAAKIAAQFTRYLIANAKVPLFDTMLAFVKENLDGVCSPDCYMKGSNTLDTNDNQLVGMVFNLFYELANGNPGRINSGVLLQILGKPEFASYYNRKAQALQQQKASAQ